MGWYRPFNSWVPSSPVFPHGQAVTVVHCTHPAAVQGSDSPFPAAQFSSTLCLRNVHMNIALSCFEHHCTFPQCDEIMAWPCFDRAFPLWNTHSCPPLGPISIKITVESFVTLPFHREQHRGEEVSHLEHEAEAPFPCVSPCHCTQGTNTRWHAGRGKPGFLPWQPHGEARGWTRVLVPNLQSSSKVLKDTL